MSDDKPYGDVPYADPGYQKDGKKRYPIDTADHVKAAWSYINMPKNASKYSSSQLSSIKSKIKAAAKKLGVEISDGGKNSAEFAQLRSMLTGAPETRAYPAEFEVRSVGVQRVQLTGYASTVNRPYVMHDMFGEYTETVRSGAFAKTLADGSDVAFLTNHGGLTLARTKTGSLTLREDSTGLLSEATINTSRTDARDLLTAIEDREITEMSFAFRIQRQEWDENYENRALVELNLDRGDVSAVNFGANPNTSITPTRAFHHISAVRAHSIATKLRSGEQLSASQIHALTRALEYIADGDVLANEEALSVLTEDGRLVRQEKKAPEYLYLLRDQFND